MFIVSALIASSLLTADVSIEDVLPDNTIAFATVTDVSELVTHLQNMGLSDAICDIAQTVCGSQEITGDESCPIDASYFSEDGTITLPGGQASWGLYPVADLESDTIGIGMLAFLQLEDEKLESLIKQGFEKHAKANEVEIETVDISGRDVWMVQFNFDLPADSLPMPINIDAPSNLYFANTDGFLIFGTEPDGFDFFFSAIDDDPIEESLGSNSVYDALMTRCGTEGDVKAGVLLTNLADTLLQMDASGMAMMMMPMAKTIFGDIDGIAETVSFAPSQDVMLEGKYAILMESGRSGLLGLISEDATASSIPSFVSDDTITYSQSSIAFDKVLPLMKEVLSSNPMFALQFNPQMMEQMEAGVSMYLSPLGSQMHFVTSGTEPYTDGSVGFMAAIECVDEEQLSSVLSLMMPSVGAEPSDFLGNQIFTVDVSGGMMMPMDLSMSVAVAGGYVFLGSQHSVENALRSIAHPKEAKSTHGTNSAVSILGHENMSGWGYGDIAKSMMMQKAMNDSLLEMYDEQLSQIEEFDPEMAAEMRAEADMGMLKQDALYDALMKCFGPMAWNLRADDTGLTAEVLMLRPTK